MPGDGDESAADPVLDHHLLGVAGRRVGRLGRAVGPRALPAEGRFGVGEDVELEVVEPVDELVEPLERLGERTRPVGAVDPEGGHRSQRHRVDDAERAESDPGRAEAIGVGRSR